MKFLRKKFDNLNIGLKFFVLVIILYFIFFLFNQQIIIVSLYQFFHIIVKILPSILVSFVLIFIFNYFLDNTQIKSYLTSKLTWKKYLITAFLGILSSGPIYFWFPFLADLKGHGLSDGLISVFLYNRAIKVPLMPVMMFYFSLQYILLLTILMISFSIINGILINKLTNKKYAYSYSVN